MILSPTPDTAPPCAAESTLTVQPVSDRRPLDVILVVDNAPTMTSAIVDLERSLNGSFADPLSKSAIDYRIILISRFGSSQNQGICIGAPLTGNNCGLLKGPPVNGPRLFHYDMDIQGQDSLDQLLVNYRRGDVWGIAAKGWSGLLRQNAFKFFVVVSDGDAVTRGGQFLFNLRVTDNAMFGAGQNPNFVFHVVVGSKGTWGPKDPLQIMTCGPGVNNAGLNLQELAIMTGGLRYPICDGFNVTLKDSGESGHRHGQAAAQAPLRNRSPHPPAGHDSHLDDAGLPALRTAHGAAGDAAAGPGCAGLHALVVLPDAEDLRALPRHLRGGAEGFDGSAAGGVLLESSLSIELVIDSRPRSMWGGVGYSGSEGKGSGFGPLPHMPNAREPPTLQQCDQTSHP